MPIDTHLCLVSAQPTPNLTPALDLATAPRRVILLVSPDMRRRADWVAAVLGAKGIPCEPWQIQDAWDVEHVQRRVLELLGRESALIARRAIALNATGGTKPMSIAAYEAFRAYELPIFYVHPENDRLIWLNPAGQASVDLANRLGFDLFLRAHGTHLVASCNTPVPDDRRVLTNRLVAGIGGNARALGTLNWLAAQARETLVSPPIESRQRYDRRLAVLLDGFTRLGLLRVVNWRLHFADEAARFYVNGGWLEEHVFALLEDLRPRVPVIQDLARSLDILRETVGGESVANEIDVACLAENRLYLVECKTRTWQGPDAGAAGADALYRLDTLSDLLGGLQARAMLVSYRDLPPRVLRRAADLGVRVCAGTRLADLARQLAAWLS